MITNDIINTISETLYTEFYRFKRYDTPTTIVLFESESESESEYLLDVLAENIRRTDSYIQVDATKAIVVLSHTDNAGAIGLIEKYVSLIDDDIRIGYTEVKNDDTNVKGIIRRIIHALNSDKKTDNGIVYI